MTPAAGSPPGGAAADAQRCDDSPEETDSTSETQTENSECVDVGGQRSKVAVSYRGLAVDQSAHIRRRQEADFLQQVAVLSEYNSDLRDKCPADTQ